MDSITIILQPKDLHVTLEQQTGLVVQAINNSGSIISYQWQKSTEPNIWQNVGTNSNILSFIAYASINEDKYRVILSSGSHSTGLTILASDTVTVYVGPRPTNTPTPTMTPTPTATPTKPRIYIAGVKNLVLDQSKNKLYASAGHEIKVIDTTSNQITSSFSITSPANIWKMIGKNSSLYVSDTINNQIIQLSKSSGDIEKITNINSYPMDMQLNDETLYVLATSHRENSLRKVQNGQTIYSLKLSEESYDRFIRLIINKNNNKAYVLDASSESIIVVDLRYMTVDETVYLPQASKPKSMEIDLSSNLIYVSTENLGFLEFLIIDTNNNSILESKIAIPYNQNGEQINVVNFNISYLNNSLYLADAYKSSSLFTMNTNNQIFTSTERLSGGCSSIVKNTSSNKLYISNGNSGIDVVQL